MSFRLFGVDVEVQFFFWLTAVLFGFPYMQDPTAPRGAIAIWVAVVFVSVMVHELGHALAIKRHGIEPEIALHGMGGTTSWRPGRSLGRLDLIFISLAGPFAGFALGGLTYAFARLAPQALERLPLQAGWAMERLFFVNIYWGIINLLPVLPFDGGHVLEQALGPKRARLTAAISFLAGALVAGLAALGGWLWVALIFGLGAVRSYQRFRSAEPISPVESPLRRAAPAPADALPPELAATLQSARAALAEEELDRALALAQDVLSRETVTPRAAKEALEIVAWAHLLAGRLPAAMETLAQLRRSSEPDAALAGAILFARGDLGEARRVLEQARGRGDSRKEVAGPLIQILIQQGEVPRAAAVALDIVDTLSEEDVRQMASIAVDHAAFEWAARLFQAAFDRRGLADDAYDAARAFALDGQHEHALDWLRRAVEAGFSDRGRAWSDAALEALRAGHELETVLPRP
jgi:Zn-dependent protease/thioredoxin-like negative regulator of GroEL